MSGSFPGSGTNYVALSAGGTGAAGTGAHTLVVLMNPTTVTNPFHGFASLMASSTRTRELFCDTGHLFGISDFSSGFGTITGGGTTASWWVAAISKPSGSAHYRFHLWNYASPVSGSMSHGESTGSANQGDGSTITEIRVGDADDIGNGLVAVVGVWNSVLSDGQLDTLVSNNLSDWAALSPAALISLQNWNGSTGCTDVVGTASQTGITGTVSTGANPPGFNFALGGIPYSPPRTVQGRDPGETWWIQRDRRDANTVGSAANPLPSPLDTTSRYPHLYGDWTRPAARPQQRPIYDQSPFVAVATTIPPTATRTVVARDPGETWWQQRPGRDPAMLGQPQLENELLGAADTAKRYLEPATHAPRWWMPQQPPRVATTPGLLDTALLESPLLGAADDLRRHAAPPDYYDRRLVPQQRVYVSDPSLLATAELENELLGGATTALRYLLPATNADRREMPLQRPYISDPSFYPTVAATDPLTVAWGAGGPLWWLYNTAAAQVDRREVPQQRRYVSDPALLVSALLENELLGSADDLRRRVFAAANWPRPNPLAIRAAVALGAPDADPLTLTGDAMRRVMAAAYADRREMPAQPPRWTLYFDAGPGTPPLTLAWGAGGSLWHLYNRPSRSRWPWPLPPQAFYFGATAPAFSSPNPDLYSRSGGRDLATASSSPDLTTRTREHDLEA